MKLRDLAVVVVFLLILELVVRVSFKNWDLSSNYGFFPLGAGDMLPSRDFVDVGRPDLPFRVKTNALGLRSNREYAALKPKGTLRVLALGDSFTYGVNVNNSDPWPQQLEILLRNEDQLRAEVFNAGVVGYTITDEYFQFKEKGVNFDPDVVVVAFYANDLNDFTPRMRAFFKRREHSTRVQQAAYRVKEILRHSALYCGIGYLRFQLNLRLTPKHLAPREDKSQPYQWELSSAGNPDYLKQYLAAADRLADVAGAHHIPVAFVLFPSYIEIAQSQAPLEKAKATIRAHLEKRHIPVLDLLPVARAAGNAEALYLLPSDWHMNRYGYSVAAHAIRGFLRTAFADRLQEFSPGSEQSVNKGRAALAGNDQYRQQ